MGRRAIPIDLLLIQGKKNLTKDEIQTRQDAEKRIKPNSDKIRPPTWLDPIAKKEFKKIVNELIEVDLITNVDINALATYCDSYSDYIQCTKIIQDEGLMVEYTNKAAETNKVPHPLLTKKKQLHEQMKSIAMEFGLTPASRAKIAITIKEKEQEPSPEGKMFGDV